MSSTEPSGDRRDTARDLLRRFAEETGVTSARPERRYLWTDAFAVCTCLGLDDASGSGEEDAGRWLETALRLVEQVHHVLGRHRGDDPRTGWISGLSEAEGERHPTAGGLRIGKELPEREAGEPIDRRREWDRDGQYYHYLTRWMHALMRAGEATGRPNFLRWARELAAAAHEGFTYRPRPGAPPRIYWKMSIDLSRPLVDSMGAHDPLDGWVTFRTLQAADPWPARGEETQGAEDPGPDLSAELRELAQICEGRRWTTDDPLGIGGLLASLRRLTALAARGDAEALAWARVLAEDAVPSLDMYEHSDPVRRPAEHRLPFRELGLAIGLRGIPALGRPSGEAAADSAAAERAPADTAAGAPDEDAVALGARLGELERFLPLADAIEAFWLDPAHRAVSTWTDHGDINTVMLATTLAPKGYLGPAPAAGWRP